MARMTDELRNAAAVIAMKPFATTPEALKEMIQSQIEKFSDIAKQENISVQ